MTEEDKELAEVKREIRKLLESLSPSDLDALLGMPLLFDEVLEQAEHSPLLAERIMQLADAEYETLSPEEKERDRQLVARLLAQQESKESPRKVVESQSKTEAAPQQTTEKGEYEMTNANVAINKAGDKNLAGGYGEKGSLDKAKAAVEKTPAKGHASKKDRGKEGSNKKTRS